MSQEFMEGQMEDSVSYYQIVSDEDIVHLILIGMREYLNKQKVLHGEK